MTIPTTSQFAHTFAVMAISVGYLVTLIMFGALILILHDGEQTTSVVNAMTNMSYVALGALTFIVTGRNLLSFLGSPPGITTAITQATTQANTTSIQTIGGTPSESTATS